MEPHSEASEARLGQKFMDNTAVKLHKTKFLEFSQYLGRENYERMENQNIDTLIPYSLVKYKLTIDRLLLAMRLFNYLQVGKPLTQAVSIYTLEKNFKTLLVNKTNTCLE